MIAPYGFGGETEGALQIAVQLDVRLAKRGAARLRRPKQWLAKRIRRDVVEEDVEDGHGANMLAARLIDRKLSHDANFEILADVIQRRTDDAGCRMGPVAG